MKYHVTNNDFRQKAFKTLDRGTVLIEPGDTDTVEVSEPIGDSEGLDAKLLEDEDQPKGGPDLSILDGSVEVVKSGLAAIDLDHLDALKTAEANGKNRSGALTAIDEAIAAKLAA